jgi:hypothetical protein
MKARTASFVYSYFIPSLNAIKVGFGDDPERRMYSYTRTYSIAADFTSLKTWEMPSAGVASNIESVCHQCLLTAGFERLNVTSGDAEANEIFHLREVSYQDAVEILIEEIDDYLDYLRKSLEGKSFAKEYRSTRKKEELKKARQAEKDRKISGLEIELRNNYKSHYEALILEIKKADQHWRSMPFEQRGRLSAMFKGWKQVSEVFFQWEGVKQCVNNVPPILKAARTAKSYYLRIIKNYPYELIEAAERQAGVSLYNPVKYYELPIVYPTVVDKYQDESIIKVDAAVYEVMLCTNIATGQGSQESFRLIKEHKVLQDLLTYARQSPPPELRNL